jgi:hypothetical protein
MEPEGSLPLSQVPATCPYPEPQRSTPCRYSPLPEDSPYYSPPIYARVFQMVYFPEVSPPKPCIHLYTPHTCYTPRPPHSSQFYDTNNMGWVQIIKLLVMYFSPFLFSKQLKVSLYRAQLQAEKIWLPPTSYSQKAASDLTILALYCSWRIRCSFKYLHKYRHYYVRHLTAVTWYTF